MSARLRLIKFIFWTLFLDSVKLYAFLNSYSQFVLSFDEVSNIFYESPYVKYRLDTVKLNIDDVRVKINPNDYSNWVKFPITKSPIAVFKALYGFAVRLSDSKILVNDMGSEAFYTLYKYSLIAPADQGIKDNVIIRRLDLSTLKEIVDDNTRFAFTKERLFFEFEYGIVSFLRVPFDVESFMYPKTFLTGDLICTFRVDVSLVKRALKLSGLFNVDNFTFHSKGADVYLVISDKAEFKVGAADQWGDASSFSVGSDNFSNLLSTVTGSGLIIKASEHGVELHSEEGGEVYSMARVSMSQIKQGNLPPVLAGTGGVPASKPQEAKVGFQDKEVF